jgi:hypothetical protein
MRSLRFPWIAATIAVLASGCVYPHRSTSLTAVQRTGTGTLSAPSDIWQLTIVDAQINPRKRGALTWDEGGGLPDAFVRVYRGAELLFETPVVNDDLTPEWNATLPRNVRVPHDARLRFEVWDSDTVGNDPVGQFNSSGLPANAEPDANARLMMEGGNYLTIRVSAPRPHRGVGIEDYEVRPDSLVVSRVLPYSPADRAGIEPGDAIVAIGDRRVSAMSSAEAASALSMSAHRDTTVTVRDARGREREVTLDRDFVWLVM